MATTTPNFGWSVPTSSDLVKNGATAIETLGDSIDASLVDLKGGTTGQVLAKASGTDMDFTWTAIDPLVILDAKGDLITATAADTPARLAVGANNTVLTADSSTATGLKWAAAAGGGKVLQVLMATDSSWTQSATNTFVDTGLSLAITPSSATSKVLAFVSQSGTGKANNQTWGEFILLRGATTIITFEDRAGENGSSATNDVGTTSTVYLDSPATTSATTYKTQFRSGNNLSRAEAGVASSTSTLVLMEIGA